MALPSAARIEGAADGFPKVGLIGWALIVVRVLAMLVAVMICVPMHLLTRLFGLRSPWPKWFLWAMGRISGAVVTIDSKPLPSNVFFISNHVSWVDILVLAGASGTAYIAKAEVRNLPVVNWLCSLNKTIFVARGDRLGVAAQIAMVRDALAETRAVTVFPEGTTTDGQSLLPFKTSLLAVIEPAPPGLMVQPVFIDYGPEVENIAWVGQENGLHNVARILARWRPIPVTIHFLKAFDPAEIGGRKAVAAESRRQIEEAQVASLGRDLRPFTLHDVD